MSAHLDLSLVHVEGKIADDNLSRKVAAGGASRDDYGRPLTVLRRNLSGRLGGVASKSSRLSTTGTASAATASSSSAASSTGLGVRLDDLIKSCHVAMREIVPCRLGGLTGNSRLSRFID